MVDYLHDGMAAFDHEGMAEERFLLLAQVELQKLINQKGLKYRDLSKRLGVSEARVSQMFGDEAANLTIRTIARIFARLDEEPVLMSKRELDALLGGRSITDLSSGQAWMVALGDTEQISVPQAEVVRDLDDERAFRAPKLRDWIEAEPGMLRRA